MRKCQKVSSNSPNTIDFCPPIICQSDRKVSAPKFHRPLPPTEDWTASGHKKPSLRLPFSAAISIPFPDTNSSSCPTVRISSLYKTLVSLVSATLPTEQLENSFFLIQIYILAFIRQRLKTDIYNMFPISSQHVLSYFQPSEMRIINL